MKSFEELGVSAEIVRAVTEMGFEHPMPVQEAVIPYLLGENNDVVALAQTGTGKTAAFGLPTLQKVNPESRVTQALVLCPTRELCLQIAGDLDDFSKYLPGVHIVPVYGGTNIEPQIRTLKQGVQIIVATPGRLIDLMERGAAHLDQVNTVILDEADEMLSMGFTDSLNTILEQVPENRNILLFSATMSKEIERISRNYLHDAKEIVVGSRNEGSENVNHVYYMVQAKDKYFALKRIVDYYPKIYGIIFCRTKRETQEVADKLIQDGYNADALHGDLSQQQRDLTMQKFRQHHTQLLVATDVAARGLDVDDLSHVINYGMPDDIENYTHRSGRTGRAGKKGTSICIIHVRERSKIREIEKVIGKEFVEGDIPSGKDICAKQLYKVIDDIERVEVDEEEIADFLPEVYRKLEWLDKEELIKRVVSSEFGRFLRYYANAPEIEKPLTSEQRKNRKKGENGAEEGYKRIFLNVGKFDGFYAREIMALINRYAGDVEVGRIDLMRSFSFFEVPEADADRVIQSLSGAFIKGRNVNVELAGEKPAEKKGKSSRSSEKSSKGRSGEKASGKRSAEKSTGKRSEEKAAGRKGRRMEEEEFYGGRASKRAEKRGRTRYGQDPFVEEERRQEREEEFLSGKRKAGKDDWKQFFMHNDDKKKKSKNAAPFELKGEEPDFAEEGWARRKPRKK